MKRGAELSTDYQFMVSVDKRSGRDMNESVINDTPVWSYGCTFTGTYCGGNPPITSHGGLLR